MVINGELKDVYYDDNKKLFYIFKGEENNSEKIYFKLGENLILYIDKECE
jgi:hypothetical protein